MSEDSFLACVENNFGFLVNQYGFVMHDHLYSSDPWSDGIIEFQSPATIIRVGKDRNSFFVLMKPANEPDVAIQSLPAIVEALSIMKEDEFLGPTPPSSYLVVLKQYAEVLKKYCLSFIKGDFSKWNNILKYDLAKMKKRFSKWPPEAFADLENYIQSKNRI